MIHRSSAGGRRSGLCLPPGPSHSLPALPDNGLRERKMEVNIVMGTVDRGQEEKKTGARREGQIGGTDAEKETCSICISL